MIRDWVDVALISVIVVGICVVIALIPTVTSKWDDCEKRGGTVLKTQGGYICAKIERM